MIACYVIGLTILALTHGVVAFSLKSIMALIACFATMVPVLMSMFLIAVGSFEQWYPVVFWITTGANAMAAIMYAIGAALEPLYLLVVISYVPWFLYIVPNVVSASVYS